MWSLLVLLTALLPLSLTMDSRRMEKMDTMGLISAHGSKARKYVVHSADGYVLKLHRLMGRARGAWGSRGPVLLQHGMLCGSDAWVLRGDKDLAFMLQEEGYDVWLGNIRGNNYCMNHVSMNHSMDKFWDYSFHEMGYYDVPAMIDLILAESGARQLFYIGHSMGTTMFYVMCSTRPEYNRKVRAMFSLAPVAFMDHFPRPLKQLSQYRFQIWDMFNKQRIFQVWPRMPWLAEVEANLCRDGSPFQSICLEVLFSISGRDYKQFNRSLFPMVVHHLSSTNPKTLAHYGQNVHSGRFQWFDYGPKWNQKVYDSYDPPDYDLSLITAPVSLHYSTNDFLSYEKDVLKLARLLPNLIGINRVPYKTFNHIDYLWATDADSILYKDIIHLMRKL